MALQEPLMIYYERNQNQHVLTPPYGMGMVIKKIYVPRGKNAFLKITIQKTLVGWWSVGRYGIGNNLYLPGRICPEHMVTWSENAECLVGGYITCEENMYNYFVEKGLFRPYRVAQGESIIFELDDKTSFDLIVVYELYDADDVDPTEPNGSRSTEFDFVNYVAISQAVTGEHLVTVTLNPVEFPAFPVGERVPAEYEITIWGIAGLPQVEVATSNTMARTRYIKFLRGRTVLFSEQKMGIPFEATFPSYPEANNLYFQKTYTIVNGHNNLDPHPAYVFPQPLTFEPGEEFQMFMAVEKTGPYQISGSWFFPVALLETVKRVR